MLGRLNRRLLALAALAPILATGCGGGESGGNGAVALTKRLSPDLGYAVADLTAAREALGLPEDADPLARDEGGRSPFLPLVQEPFGSLGASIGRTPVTDVVDPALVRGVATDLPRAGSEPVTVVRTDADTGEIGSSLGDLGYAERGGILELPRGLTEAAPSGRPESGISVVEGPEQPPAFLLEDGLVFISLDPAALRDLPAEPLDELPTPLLEALDEPAITTFPGPECTSGLVAGTNVDGGGEVAFGVPEDPDPTRLEISDGAGVSFEAPEVDGDLVVARFDSAQPTTGAAIVVGLLAVDYDCP